MISNINPTQSIIKAYKVQSKRNTSKVSTNQSAGRFVFKDKVEISKTGREFLMKDLSSKVQRLTGALDSIMSRGL